ncbi:MAG TPA: efflux RND transporter permease subunit [Limnochordales bacterium]
MRLSELFVRRPVTTGMFIVAILLFGGLSWSGLGLELYPDMQLPYITVATLYPNADPQTVETEVTHQVEGVLSTAAGLTRLESISMENISLVFAEFGWGTALDETIAELRARLAALTLTLPADAQAPVVMRLDPTEFPSLLIGVSGRGEMMEVTDAALQVIRPRLERVPGVAQVAVLGGVEREIQVLYDSAKLREHDLTPAHLQQLLSLQNATVPAGVLEHDGRRWQARVGNHFTSVQEIRDLVIGESRLPVEGLAALWPPLLRVKDVAQVVDGVREPTGYARIDGRPTVLLQVFKQSGANTVAVADGVLAALAELERELPDLSLTVIVDQSAPIRRSLESLIVYGLIGAGIVVAVLFLFLRHWRSLLVVALSIPLSILLTLMALYACRFDLNLMTLGGLALATGMVVDNAIIVLENIFRRRSEGEDAIRASIEGSREMTAAIIGATLTTVAVFLPAAFMDTFVGQLFKELGITVSLALGASLLIALTVVPSLGAGLLGGDAPLPHVTWEQGRIVRAYVPLLERALDRRGWLLALVAALGVASLAIVPRLGTEFLPPGHARALYVTMETAPGTPLAETDAVARAAEERLRALPAVERVAAQVGEQRQEDIITLLGDYGANTIQLIAFLRSPASPEQVPAVAAEIRQALSDLPVARLAVSKQWSSSNNLLSNDVVLQLSGPDLETLQDLAFRLRDRLAQNPAVADVHVPLATPQPELFLAVNQSRALIGGLTTAQVSLAVRYALSGIQVTQVRENGRTIPVVLRPQPSETADLDQLLNHPISSPVLLGGDAARVRLGNVVEVVEGTAPQAIRRIDGMRALEVRVRPSGQDLTATLAAVQDAVAAVDLPPGYQIQTTGIRQLIDESLDDLGGVLLWSLVLVYAVMAAQFESWRHPLIIMVTAPLAALGSVWAMWLAGQKLGVASMIGLIMLGGIAVNNGIVLVDRVLQLRAQGVANRTAVVEAARSRLRPVLMTAITTIAGMLPMAVSRGEGTEFQVPLAVTVIGGLFTATLLTLFVVPALCLMVDARRAPGAGAQAASGAARGPAAGAGRPANPAPRARKGGAGGRSVLLALLGTATVVSLLPAAPARAQPADLQWIVGIGYTEPDPHPWYLVGAGWERRVGDWRWRLQLQVAGDPQDAVASAALDAGAEWFQPVSFFGYYELQGRLTLRRTGGGPILSALSLRGDGVLGNITGTVEFDVISPGFPVQPWDPYHRARLAAGGDGRYHLRVEVRQQPNRELNLIREVHWSRTRAPGTGPGAFVAATGTELRAGNGWLGGKVGVRLDQHGWQPVFGAGYRFRPSPYSQLTLGAVSATAIVAHPSLSISYELLTETLTFTAELQLTADAENRYTPVLYLQGEPHASGWQWQLRVGSPATDQPVVAGLAIAI